MKCAKKPRKCASHTGKSKNRKSIVNRNFPEEAQMFDLLDKDLKSTIANMFKELKETISRELNGSVRTMEQHLTK